MKPAVPVTDKLALSVEEASALTGLGINFIYAAVKNGTLRAIGSRRRIRVTRADLDDWLREVLPAIPVERPARVLQTRGARR